MIIRQTSREALIVAATEMFAERGLDVSLDELCAHAGYTRGAFYVHFSNRDDLIAAVMERVSRQSLDVLLGRNSSDGLDMIVHRFSRRLRSGDHPMTKARGVRPHQLLDACARSSAVRDQYVSVIEMSIARLAEALRSNQKSSVMRGDVDARHTAVLLEAMAIGFEIMHDLNMPADFDGCANAILKLLRR